MKILFSSNKNPHFFTITEYIKSALDKVSECRFFEDRNFFLPGRIRDRVASLQKWDLSRINRNLISEAKKFKPEVLLQTGGHRIFPQTIKAIKDLGVKTVLWTIDFPTDFEPVIASAPVYDFVFTGGSEAYEILKPYNIKNLYWLPFACDTDFHKPTQVTQGDKAKYACDIVFIGSFYQNRLELLEQISDFDLGVWGPGWEKVPGKSPLKKRIRRAGGVKPQEWVKIYSSSKVCLVIHYQDGKILSYQASPKVYEILACRRFLLVDNQKDVLSLFADGKHLAIFKDIKELREKIRYYLDNPGEREIVAKQGYDEVVEKHTFINRIKEMLSIVNRGG